MHAGAVGFSDKVIGSPGRVQKFAELDVPVAVMVS
jgi:hypothetical protein